VTEEFLVGDSLWWDGRVRVGEALSVAADGRATPVPLAGVPAGAPRRRLPGTLLPGLCDAHVHSALVHLATVRAGGIASVWDLGGVPEKVSALAAGPPGPKLPGPKLPGPKLPGPKLHGPKLPAIRFAGPFLTAPGGYPSDRPWAPAGSWREIHSPAEAADAVGEVRATGATLIKVTAHAGGPLLPAKTMTALAEAAHAAGLPVVVHAEGAGTVASAADCDADVLAHTPWTEPLDPGLVRACAARMRWISTLDIHGWGRETPESITAIGNLRRFLEYGGSVRYGTDLGNGPLPPGINPREIRALQAAGLSPDGVLRAMTGDGVSWLPCGLDLDPARFADVLATARVLDDTVRPRD
jgi:imidazolonepropionase-like amidohydrolase